MLTDRWITDSARWERLPYYTRANAGEVLPDPASPLGWTLVFEQGLLKGWLRGFVEFGIYRPGELPADPPPVAGLFGGYFYLNLSHMRLMGIRMGQTVEQFDAAFLGPHPDKPPYEPHPDDPCEECSAKIGQTIGQILAAASFPDIDADYVRVRLAAQATSPAGGDVRRRTGRARPVVPARAGQRVRQARLLLAGLHRGAGDAHRAQRGPGPPRRPA